MAVSNNRRLLSALESKWQAEMEGFHIYPALSEGEADAHRRNILRGLAMAEKLTRMAQNLRCESTPLRGAIFQIRFPLDATLHSIERVLSSPAEDLQAYATASQSRGRCTF
jgi:hypothetical protein